MWKKELWLETQFINNFYQGPLHKLVFIDLEFFPVYITANKVQQRIFGYTITRILETNDSQYIKIQLIENYREEKYLIKEIINDLKLLQDKIFVGFNIINSDLYCLTKRIRSLKLKPDISPLTILDLYDPKQSRYRGGLNGLFEYLDITIDKEINGLYIRRNAKRVLSQKENSSEIINRIYEYCLEDAKNYFHIVSNWKQKFTPLDPNTFLQYEFKVKRY
ncbi:ribonuclease H-like domain-containing protein [Laspinema olomoucense]|uniref:ribonuclease H-like domain-containing protein n=1 Tax=Laspinema olomoucense TaxID=3231600 RepID=UPI0021BABDA1|nr:ribonuclease H-like domain-containing protein [Laspinema sp. D3c]MCT7994071.1 hypothetical protein [Laspinema sp. D3c]